MMNGCTEYDAMSLTVYFPAGHVCCDLCPALETYARKQCRMTGEYLMDTRVTGLRCPLRPEEEKQSAADMEAKLRDAVNELCLRCGEYRQQHLGACDGCKFKDMK